MEEVERVTLNRVLLIIAILLIGVPSTAFLVFFWLNPTDKYVVSRSLSYQFEEDGTVDFLFERETPHGPMFGYSWTEIRGPIGTCSYPSELHTYESRAIGDPARYTEYDETRNCIVKGKTFVYDVKRRVLWNDLFLLRSSHDVWTCKHGKCER